MACGVSLSERHVGNEEVAVCISLMIDGEILVAQDIFVNDNFISNPSFFRFNNRSNSKYISLTKKFPYLNSKLYLISIIFQPT